MKGLLVVSIQFPTKADHMQMNEVMFAARQPETAASRVDCVGVGFPPLIAAANACSHGG